MRSLLIIVATLGLLAGCATSAAPTLTPTPTSVATATPAPASADSPSTTPTSTPAPAVVPVSGRVTFDGSTCSYTGPTVLPFPADLTIEYAPGAAQAASWITVIAIRSGTSDEQIRATMRPGQDYPDWIYMDTHQSIGGPLTFKYRAVPSGANPMQLADASGNPKYDTYSIMCFATAPDPGVNPVGGYTILHLVGPNGPAVPTPTVTPVAPTPSAPPAAFVCPPGNNPDRAGSAGQARPSLSQSALSQSWSAPAPMAFDTRTGQAVVFDVAESRLWTFDVCSNHWTRTEVQLAEPTDVLLYDPYTDAVLVNEAGDFGEYDLASGQRRDIAEPPFSRSMRPPLVAYRDAEQQLVARPDKGVGVWAYDRTTDTWAMLPVNSSAPSEAFYSRMVYEPSVDRLFVHASCSGITCSDHANKSFEYDFVSGDWTLPDDWGLDTFLSFFNLVYDEKSGMTLEFADQQVLAFSPGDGTWQPVGYEGPGTTDLLPTGAASAVYDTVNGRVLILDANSGAMIAFRLDGRVWTKLLAASSATAG